ncbi:MAG: hypothetical protein IKO68_08235 [Oscillospiraceae bacterium]|nr:hypothetical protein [Oscillospiraceae bacterium]
MIRAQARGLVCLIRILQDFIGKSFTEDFLHAAFELFKGRDFPDRLFPQVDERAADLLQTVENAFQRGRRKVRQHVLHDGPALFAVFGLFPGILRFVPKTVKGFFRFVAIRFCVGNLHTHFRHCLFVAFLCRCRPANFRGQISDFLFLLLVFFGRIASRFFKLEELVPLFFISGHKLPVFLLILPLLFQHSGVLILQDVQLFSLHRKLLLEDVGLRGQGPLRFIVFVELRRDDIHFSRHFAEILLDALQCFPVFRFAGQLDRTTKSRHKTSSFRSTIPP